MLHFPIVNNIMSSFSSYLCVSILEILVFCMMLDVYACRMMFLCFDGRRTMCVGFHCPHSRLFQVGGFRSVPTAKRQKLTKGLLSGSEKTLLIKSKSEGASCNTAPLSKPYMFRSTTDAASAAIDYLKGNIEDGSWIAPQVADLAELPFAPRRR